MSGDRVLVVDDNPVNLKLVRAVLAADGYDIRTAADGPEIWTVLAKFRPRLILMDVQLPGANGFELTRRLKSDPATRDIIVVAITAYAMPDDEERAHSAGCSGLIAKPVDTRTLPATVKLHLGIRQAAKPAFQPGDYHDLLAELRANFLVDGEEESGQLLRTLAQGFDLDRAQRTAHRWTGIAGILGFAEIARKARGIEDFLADPGERRHDGRARGMIAAGECVSRLRSELLGIRQMFSHAVRGKRETPDLPLAVWQVLADKRFAVIGFERAEAARICGALEHARARCRVFGDLPDNGTLQPFQAGVVNVCQGEGIFSWAHSGVSADSIKPILFVGSAETLLRREPGIPERSWDFLLGPWDADELIFRAYRLFSSNANRDLTGASGHGRESRHPAIRNEFSKSPSATTVSDRGGSAVLRVESVESSSKK
jgi:two-component system cell cycle response regulator DivK